MNEESKTIKVIGKNGDITDREVKLNPYRLSRGKKMQLKKDAMVQNFMEIDYENTTNLSEARYKSFDMLGSALAKDKAIDSATKILWGIEDLSDDNISDIDFEELRKVVIEKDYMGFRLEELEEKKAEQKQNQITGLKKN